MIVLEAFRKHTLFDRFLNILIHIFKSAFNLIVTSFGVCGQYDDIVVDVLYKSDDYLIVNKPEDVFVNNHGKQVSVPILNYLLFF